MKQHCGIGGIGLLVALTLAADAGFARGDTGRTPYTRNVAIVIWENAEILDWAGPTEVFAAASGVARHCGEKAFNVYTVSKTRDPIASQGFVDVVPDYSIADAPKPDIVLFPGGGVRAVTGDPEFLEWAAAAAKEAEVAMSVCTGAFILGTAGLLDGKDATTWYGAIAGLEQQFSDTRVHRGRRFVDNGQVITTAGVSAGIDGSMHVVARLLGRHNADRTAQYMEYDWSPEAYLAAAYPALNPSLDERGRRAQQAGIYSRENDHAAAMALFEQLIEEDPGDVHSWYGFGSSCYAEGRYDRALEAYTKAAESEPLRAGALYNAACSASLMEETDRAFELLEEAIDAGYSNRSGLAGDPDLTRLHDDGRWKELLAALD